MTPREDIAELVHAYSDAVLHRDAERWAACWAPDAVWTLTGGRHVEGRDAIVGLWRASMDAYEAVVQHVHSGSVHLEGGRGAGRWHISEHCRRRDGAPSILLAYYDDEYVRLDAQWYFARRALHVQYQGPPDLSAPFQPTES
jgi:ketosteroid isomerase-like protein